MGQQGQAQETGDYGKHRRTEKEEEQSVVYCSVPGAGVGVGSRVCVVFGIYGLVYTQLAPGARRDPGPDILFPSDTTGMRSVGMLLLRRYRKPA